MTEVKMVTIPLAELENLKTKNRNQAHQIKFFNETMTKKNLDLDALHFTWCDGGCPNGVHRFSDLKLTEEMIVRAERNVKRMRSWYNTVKWRITGKPTLSAWHRAAARRTDLLGDEE